MATGAALFAAGWILTGWRAETQIQKNMQSLMTWSGDRDWKRVGSLLSDSYRDGWGQSKSQALASGEEFGKFFLTLEITGHGVTRVEADRGEWQGKLAFSGRGTALGEMIFSRAGELKEDFVFAWQKENWKPWSWKLVSVSQSEIVFDSQWLQ